MAAIGICVNARGALPDWRELQTLGLSNGYIRSIVYNLDEFAAAVRPIKAQLPSVKICALLNSETDGVGDDYAGWVGVVREFSSRLAGVVSAVEAGNELDSLGVEVAQAAHLARSASPLLRAAGMKVILTSVAGPNWVDYMRRLATATQGYADFSNLHGYGQRAAGFPQGWGFGELSDAIQTANEVSGLPVALTEGGIKVGDAGGVDGQAGYVRRWVSLVQSYSEARVPFGAYFAWRDDVGAPSERGDQAFGLRAEDGTPRPAWQAFAVAAGSGAVAPAPPAPIPPVTPPVVAPQEPQGGPFRVGAGIEALAAARGWKIASTEDYSQESHSETLLYTPDGPRIAEYWHAQKRLVLGPVLEVVG